VSDKTGGRPRSGVSGLALGKLGPCREPLDPAKGEILRWAPRRGVEWELLGAKKKFLVRLA
jgi:hypothetical protein